MELYCGLSLVAAGSFSLVKENQSLPDHKGGINK